MHDRNKTELTHILTQSASVWLDGKGFKPVETEVGVAPGWVADVAGVCSPTTTELINLKLIPEPPRFNEWGHDTAGWNRVRAKWETETKDMRPSLLTALIEVKTSVGDYRRDQKWLAADWPANLCYVAMPEGMIPEDQWPARWGVLLFGRSGRSVRGVIPPAVQTCTVQQHLDVIYSLAVSRDHHTRHARVREFHKQVRISDGERQSVERITKAFEIVNEVLRGRSLDEAILYCGLRLQIPDYVKRNLTMIGDMAKRQAAIVGMELSDVDFNGRRGHAQIRTGHEAETTQPQPAG